jgi:hypothetical protein
MFRLHLEADKDVSTEMVMTVAKYRFATSDSNDDSCYVVEFVSGNRDGKARAKFSRDARRSPDIRFFGYRFRIFVKEDMALGDICWDPWPESGTWQILPKYPLSRLNPRSELHILGTETTTL